MNRHHPYGGSFEGQPSRRGGSPSGPGPDRSHRYHDRGGGPPRGRGGFGRGRGGGYSSFDGNMSHDPYDQGQGDMGGYDAYEGQPQQNSYYQNNYGAPSFAPSAAPYNQDHVKYEGALET